VVTGKGPLSSIKDEIHDKHGDSKLGDKLIFFGVLIQKEGG
jgi:hypothetical protein